MFRLRHVNFTHSPNFIAASLDKYLFFAQKKQKPLSRSLNGHGSRIEAWP
jgi:hypothetical protein